MTGKTSIEWTDMSWNPIVGCSIVSKGCTNCYAMRMAARLERMNPALDQYHGLTKVVNGNTVWTGKIGIAPDHVLLAPLRRKKPTRYFVNSMSDLFHEGVPDEVIDRVFAVMALCPQHTFQALTKRPERMREYLSQDQNWQRWAKANLAGHSFWSLYDHYKVGHLHYPLPNVHLGVSVEDQTTADERIPLLLATPASVSFISAEPLLGRIRFDQIRLRARIGNCDTLNGLNGNLDQSGGSDFGQMNGEINQIIVGGESGPGARVWEGFYDAARSIRDQCKTAGTAFYMKQTQGVVKRLMPAIPDDLMIRELPNNATPEVVR